MKTIFKIIITALLLIAISFKADAQKKKLIADADEITTAATKVFKTSMLLGGGLYELAKENEFTGAYVFDITIRNKGEVASVFVVENEGGTITTQNRLKDYVMDMKMDFKMPKGKKYKFQYTFNFN